MKRRVVFRADGGPEIGMGHFIRTLALAEILKDDFFCIYATQKPTVYQINEIKNICKERMILPNDDTHFDFFLNCLRGDEIVVLDNYFFSTEYQQNIKNLGCKLVCIDDMHDKHYVADIVINHAEGIDEKNFSIEQYTKLCLGYQYALLRNIYLIDDNIDIPKEYSWFIMMGSADPYNLTLKILAFLEPQSQNFPVAVVVGSVYENDAQLNAFSNINVYKGIKSEEVYHLMKKSRFGILPASTVSIEACAARMPFICGYYINNQIEIYNGIKKNMLAICVDSFLNLKKNIFHSAITEINNNRNFNEIKNSQAWLLDKKSKERLLKIFNTL